MPHARARHALPLLLKKLRFSRVVSIQGARQTGKSFLAREILAKTLKSSEFVSFDQSLPRSFADTNPDSFLEAREQARPLVIDEAQKVPGIFDAVKHQVDLNPEPGRYLLLGSTEFSREVRVRESLTGRLSRLRIYPFSLAESLQKPLNPSKSPVFFSTPVRATRQNLLRHLDRGGFPGIFSVRDEKERRALMQDWLELACSRDLLQFARFRPSPELAMQLFREIARRPLADQAELVRATGRPARIVAQHLDALTQLFAVERIPPHHLGTGKHRFLLCDTGLVSHLEGRLQSRLLTWVISEYLGQLSYRGDLRNLHTYRGSRGGLIEVVLESGPDRISAVKVLTEERIDLRDLEILRSFETKARAAGYREIRLHALAAIKSPQRIGEIHVHPWEAIV